MPAGNVSALTAEVKAILSQNGGRKSTDEVARQWATAIANYIDSIVVEVPASQVIVQVAGQAVGTPNPAPINCTVR